MMEFRVVNVVNGRGGCGPVEGEDDEVVSDSMGRDCVVDIVGDGVTSCVCRVCEGAGFPINTSLRISQHKSKLEMRKGGDGVEREKRKR
ncbi:hypothetical protein Tco_1356336 [Tanacetum coccineum]